MSVMINNINREQYLSKLEMIYNDFVSNISDWRRIENAKPTIQMHTLSFDDPELVNEIQVSFYRIACYSNLAVDFYMMNKFDELGINNFFDHIKDIVGPIEFFDLEKLNKSRLAILDNTTQIVKDTTELYVKMKNTSYSDDSFYSLALKWFICATSIVQSIVNTVISALKSYIEDTPVDESIDVTKVREGKGFRLNEIPSITIF